MPSHIVWWPLPQLWWHTVHQMRNNCRPHVRVRFPWQVFSTMKLRSAHMPKVQPIVPWCNWMVTIVSNRFWGRSDAQMVINGYIASSSTWTMPLPPPSPLSLGATTCINEQTELLPPWNLAWSNPSCHPCCVLLPVARLARSRDVATRTAFVPTYLRLWKELCARYVSSRGRGNNLGHFGSSLFHTRSTVMYGVPAKQNPIFLGTGWSFWKREGHHVMFLHCYCPPTYI